MRCSLVITPTIQYGATIENYGLILTHKTCILRSFCFRFNHVKNVILINVMNVETLKIVFNELYLRLTEYSRLVYSKHTKTHQLTTSKPLRSLVLA